MHLLTPCRSGIPTKEAPNFSNKGTTPISKLPDDLLWRIFLMNANMDDDAEAACPIHKKDLCTGNRALTNTRHTSQVCCRWRGIILNSPSLWGRLVHITLFRQRTNLWMDEVVRRTANAPLYIFGITNCSKRTAYVVDLLDRHWNRVRVFDLRISSYTVPQAHRLRDILCRSSPNLRIFRMAMQPTGDKFTGQIFQFNFVEYEDSQLFADDAPLMRHFLLDSFKFGMNSSTWICGLQTLTICNSMVYDATEFFSVLERMPLLEVLHLVRFQISFDDYKRFKPLILPRLQVITMHGDIWNLVKFLDPITPAPECSVGLDMTYHASPKADETLPWAFNVLNRYTKSYFKHTVCTSLCIEVTPTCLRLIDTTPITTSTCRRHPDNMRVDLFLRDEPNEFNDILPFLECLKHVELFKCVTQVYFTTLTTITCRQSFSLLPFIAGLQSIETLTTSEEGLRVFLPQHGRESEKVLPKLHTLPLYSGPGGDSVRGAESTVSSNTIFTFLKWRQDLGVPLQTLDFTGCWGYIRDLRVLEDDMPGLRMLWSSRPPPAEKDYKEYICGSGNPEVLKISCPAPVPCGMKFSASQDSLVDDDDEEYTLVDDDLEVEDEDEDESYDY
ncbi:hypothetical protein D9613_007396 [Agrocybe pediades]|uniref:F-box domain-containing protein n=1 Tax=Agrocybe pediades TaxID=84607 RepID=A0A8H4QNJ0_9AGAR|nr:hypothetical protein D9613_007396 [Agrocybe pediades]